LSNRRKTDKIRLKKFLPPDFAFWVRRRGENRMPRIGDTVYYKSEQEEHSDLTRTAPVIDENFHYVHKDPLWRVCSFVVYRLIMIPFAFLWCKLRFHHRIENRQVLRGFRHRGCFVYGNHTLMSGDAYIPNLLLAPKRTYVIVSPENLSARGTRSYLQMCGAIPTPGTLGAFRNFREALEKRTVERSAVVIYPEAHIWPYYTGIRPFPDTSFAYPVQFGEPVFCFTNTFHRKKHGRVPRIVTYVDGPFYPDERLPRAKQAKELRDRVYQTMCRRARLSTYAPIQYIKEEPQMARPTGDASSKKKECNA
jgi:1-acyl-sn-glycerol-3-phosphate acyltransferase